jgi:hypothetical protein
MIKAIPNAKIKQYFSLIINQLFTFSPNQIRRFGKLIDETRPRTYVPKLCSKQKKLFF